MAGRVTTVRATVRRMHTARREGYLGFGSFHAPSIGSLLEDPTSTKDLEVPFTRSQGLEMCRTTPFGGTLKSTMFLLDTQWTFLNHGAFGASLRNILADSEMWRRYIEAQPLRFFDRELFPYLVRSMRTVAKAVSAQPEGIALLPNATTGLNAVLHSFPLSAADKIMYFSTAYGSVKKMVQHRCVSVSGAKAVEVSIPIGDLTTKQELVGYVDHALTKHSGVKLCVLDHITSNTALKFPLEELIALLHEKNIAVVVDGAHGLFTMPLSLSTLNADFYIGNCHKWLSAPKGSAFMHVGPQWRDLTRPTIISHGYEDTYPGNFVWDGLRDYVAALTLPEVFEQWEVIGMNRSRLYATDLAMRATEVLASRWNTAPLLSEELSAPTMRLVRLPEARNVMGVDNSSGKASSADAKFVQDQLHFNHNIEIPVKVVDGFLYVRLSAHVYNEIEEYEGLGKVIWDGIV